MKTIRTRPADVRPLLHPRLLIHHAECQLIFPQTPLARVPATSSKALTSALAQFSQFLTSLDVLTTPRLALLSSSKLAEKVHRSALRRISQAYAEVCDRVLDKKEGYEFGETLLRRGRDEVAVALGVDGDEHEHEDEGYYGNDKVEEGGGSGKKDQVGTDTAAKEPVNGSGEVASNGDGQS